MDRAKADLGRLLRIAVAAVGPLLLCAGQGARAVDASALPLETRLSLLAVGDTGAQHALPWLREGQRSVARGMAAEDRRLPVDAVVLLGDLFYPNGIEPAALVERVRQNIALPYCHFVDLGGPRAADVRDVCTEAEDRRHVVPLLAVPGNHDYESPAGPEILRSEIPAFVRNWTVPDGIAAVVELGAGVSLVLVDTPAAVATQDFGAIRDALRRARGPWRIVAAHLPAAPGDAAADAEWRSPLPPLAHFSVADAPIHVYLAGHRHNLQLIEGRPPGPKLHVIAGSGATVRPIRTAYAGLRFGLERNGFARVDLVRHGEDERLVVTLFTMPRYPAIFWAEPRPVARWSVDRAGTLRREDDDD